MRKFINTTPGPNNPSEKASSLEWLHERVRGKGRGRTSNAGRGGGRIGVRGRGCCGMRGGHWSEGNFGVRRGMMVACWVEGDIE